MDVVIGSRDHDHVLIRVRKATDDRRGGWLICELDIRAGAWSGAFDAWLCFTDLSKLREELETLHQNLSGTAALETRERQLEMRFTIDNRGHVAVSCSGTDRPIGGNTLHFSLELDQSYLPQIIAQLAGVEAAFPRSGPTS